MPEVFVKDIMASRVVSCTADTKANEAAKLMKDNDVGSIVVMEGKKPVGIVTREDMTNKIAAEDVQPSEISVKQIMSSPVITVSPDDGISSVAKQMIKYGYERLPVKQMNKLVGFVSVRDILRVSPGMIDLISEHLSKERNEQYNAVEDKATSGECELCGNHQEELIFLNDRWVCDTCKEEAREL